MMQTAANLDFRYPTVEDAAWRRRCSAPRAGWDVSIPSPPCSCGGRFTITGWRDGGIPCLSARGGVPGLSAAHRPFPGRRGPGFAGTVGRTGTPLDTGRGGCHRGRTVGGRLPRSVRFYLSEGRFRLYLPHEGSGGAAGERLSRQTQPHRWFSRKFNWTFEPIDGRNTAEVEAMAQEWCRQKGNCKDKGLRTENCAIREVLRHRGGPVRPGRADPCRRPCRGLHVRFPYQRQGVRYSGGKGPAVLSGGVRRHQSGIRLDPDGVSVSQPGERSGYRGTAQGEASYHPAMVLEKYTCTQVR